MGFLVFLFAFFNPLSTPEKTGLTDNAIINLEEQLRTQVTSVSLNLRQDPAGCFSVDLVSDLNCNGKKVIVKNLEGTQISGSIEDNNIHVGHAGLESRYNKFYTIYCSEEFVELTTGLGDCSPKVEGEDRDYNLGVIIDRDLWSKSKITIFKNNYLSGYDLIKEDIVPQGNDFGFRIWKLNDLDTVVFEGTKDTSGVVVEAKTIGIEIVDQDGDIIKHTINIHTW